jgi:hypothetical protein
MVEQTRTLGEAIPEEQARVREILSRYKALPDNAGWIGAELIELDLKAMDMAVVSGDPVAMLRAYAQLRMIGE